MASDFLKKALTTKKPFGGICINGVYEYIYPVLVGDEVACVIYIGNIFGGDATLEKIKKHVGKSKDVINNMETSLNDDDIVAIAKLLESYILMLLENYSYQNENINPLIENIKNYIHSNLEFDIDITRLSEFFHYNKMYLGRMFKKETGMNIKDYINLQRIEKAKKMLENTKETIIDISNKVGFNNVTYFNKVFKNATSMTPSQYRSSKE